ncbi:MAG: hypothetical protein PUC77_07195 [Bacteroidales bacterium]|nr:hypothetical protein [Bacteroidales bacterium]MDD6140367.1 hypothetical protein [Bacteroidales bacterium]MDD6621852.1 hypothetical protein [Bacteroidales bacterium]MDD6670027.1 hypothetical protein [Bacteroidales bacterium]
MSEKNIIDKRTPYTVPEGFFEQAGERLSKEISRRRRLRFVRLTASAAAVVAIVVAVGYSLRRAASDDLSAAAIQQIAEAPEKYMTDEELQQWVAFAESDIYFDEQ